MLTILKQIFGFGHKTDFKELVKNGAQIVDVRSKDEYRSGHIEGSINIPLQNLPGSLKKDSPVITCCASGIRSASAKNILKSNGFVEVYNGGGWVNLQNKLN